MPLAIPRRVVSYGPTCRYPLGMAIEAQLTYSTILRVCLNAPGQRPGQKVRYRRCGILHPPRTAQEKTRFWNGGGRRFHTHLPVITHTKERKLLFLLPKQTRQLPEGSHHLLSSQGSSAPIIISRWGIARNQPKHQQNPKFVCAGFLQSRSKALHPLFSSVVNVCF